jgi:acetylornithine deacetylase/succinyl-diaminopimelate desuccinylase-like protein
MKGGLVAAAGALLYAAALGKSVALLLTSDEEIGSLGVLSHDVGDTRLMGVAPMPVWIRSVL